MKRFICLMLALLLLLLCGGCADSLSKDATFYYCTADYQFGKDTPVILGESRDISGHEGELSYLVALYLAGPSGKKLVSPFPKNTKLVSVQTEDDHVTIELSYLGRQITDSRFVLACACLTLTTMDVTDAQSVTILSGERSITMDAKDLLLYDSVTSQYAKEETQ